MNKYTLGYTIYGGTLDKPVHRKYEFEDEGDMLGALAEGASTAFEAACKEYGPTTDIILRSITHDNAQEWYKIIKAQENSNDRSVPA